MHTLGTNFTCHVVLNLITFSCFTCDEMCSFMWSNVVVLLVLIGGSIVSLIEFWHGFAGFYLSFEFCSCEERSSGCREEWQKLFLAFGVQSHPPKSVAKKIMYIRLTLQNFITLYPIFRQSFWL
jgi:hypothetical protein